MTDSPATSSSRIAVRVTPDALRQIRGGHPWLYDASITNSPTGHAGQLAVVFDDRRRFAAIGLFDPHSPIRVRILHQGAPTAIDDGFFLGRIADAVEHRAALVHNPATTGFRLVHGENDALPGLVADVYDRTMVLKVDTAAWVPHRQAVMESIEAAVPVDRFVFRASRTVKPHLGRDLRDGQVLRGDPPTGPIEFLEYGLRFGADVQHGQKTGHFLDQRENRRLAGTLARGAQVLDLFASTGGFTVHAAAGGATHVVSVDQSAPTLAAAAENLKRNPELAKATQLECVAEDAFAALERFAAQGRRFDLVIIDPPSFASKASAATQAINGYQRLTRLGLSVLKPTGWLVQSSCSSRVDSDQFFDAIESAAADAGYRLDAQTRTGHALDHPIGFAHGAYLKTMFCQPNSGTV